MSSTRDDELKKVSRQGEILRAILAEWVQAGIPLNPRLIALLVRHLGISEREHWEIVVEAASSLLDQWGQENKAAILPMHPDYYRLHQSRGSDRDYGMIGHPSLDMVP